VLDRGAFNDDPVETVRADMETNYPRLIKSTVAERAAPSTDRGAKATEV
jgi:hypothetical protein